MRCLVYRQQLRRSQIAAGNYDANVQGLCTAIQTYFGGLPVYVRIGDEFNGTAWTGYTPPSSYAAAFQRIANILHACPNTHIATAWNLTLDADPTNYMAYYPGDSYVDWWAINLYAPAHFTDPTGLQFMADSRTHGKPVLMGEASPRYIGAQSGPTAWNDWFVPFFDYVDTQPNIKMLTYINIDWGQTIGWPNWGNSIIPTGSVVSSGFADELSNPAYILASANIASRLHLARTIVPTSTPSGPKPTPTAAAGDPTPTPTAAGGDPTPTPTAAAGACNPVIISPLTGSTIGGASTFTVSGCPLSGRFVRLYVGGVTIDFPPGTASDTIDTSTLPKGATGAAVIV